MSEELYKYIRKIDYLANLPGADIERDVLKIALEYQDLALLTALARSYCYDETAEDWTAVTKDFITGQLNNIAKIGGTTLTGRNISLDLAKLQNLNITFIELADIIKGSESKDFTTLQDVVAKEDSGATVTIADGDDASGGLTAALQNFKIFTLYLTVTAACTITVELSPDNGSTWFEEPGSPYVFGAAGTQFIDLPYAATSIKVTSTTADPITAIGRGVL